MLHGACLAIHHDLRTNAYIVCLKTYTLKIVFVSTEKSSLAFISYKNHYIRPAYREPTKQLLHQMCRSKKLIIIMDLCLH